MKYRIGLQSQIAFILLFVFMDVSSVKVADGCALQTKEEWVIVDTLAWDAGRP